MRNSNPIMVVEDDSADVMMIKRAFKELNVSNPLICASNGEEALDYLRNDANINPCLIFLDINMPKMNGLEFLKIIKADDQFKKIPVVVLAASDNKDDVRESFRLSVAGYMTKSSDNKSFVEKLKGIDFYWSLCELPSANKSD